MHAIVIEEPGGPEALVWTEVPDPEPGPGEVVVEVTAAAVNRADVMQRQGHYPPPPGAPPYPGLECSGVITAVGPEVTGHHIGERVCALLAGGGYAERVAVPAGQLLPVPQGLSLQEAAALPEVACTVWSNVVDIARLRKGKTLLVHGGGGGIGTFAIQLGKALGATVVVTAREQKHEQLLALGADLAVDYTGTDFVEATRDFTEGHGADVILDIIGARYLSRNIAALAAGGRIVTIGLQGGRKGELDFGALMAKRGSIIATTLRARPVKDKSRIVRGVHDMVWPLVDAGAIRPIIDRTVAMRDAAEAHRLMEASDHLGKIVLLP
ncbi:NAD(P)H-quinone oxidoreductase [Couchioplanes caeruleus]|uniref:Crotonyl CoA reductase n=2 Tax=Couchioplanes caeruleus TaxID=56438 RepID=A0A1K0FJ82_9ACTN|nr:NAD(P)H-quinone oxidoreductase [Couchioplanes caeruleus]OJF12901.1 NADPH:quinone oxidoreductase [Couchioplanes caeruleus subsp. caeruleus]OJF15781.1 Crotonyl CoA reductase [Couchioplanes caeruleus subsp. caeruleus]ROP31244.1 putative PIG3 family NAD(P)H quinone oxidoreductase [Couchioplanes caeruleus]